MSYSFTKAILWSSVTAFSKKMFHLHSLPLSRTCVYQKRVCFAYFHNCPGDWVNLPCRCFYCINKSHFKLVVPVLVLFLPLIYFTNMSFFCVCGQSGSKPVVTLMFTLTTGGGSEEAQSLFGLQLSRASKSNLLCQLWQLHRAPALAQTRCQGTECVRELEEEKWTKACVSSALQKCQVRFVFVQLTCTVIPLWKGQVGIKLQTRL